MINHEIKIKILTMEDLIKSGCFDVKNSIQITEKAFVDYANDKIILPNKVSVIFDKAEQSRINCLPAGLKEQKIYGMKWVSVFPQNPIKREKDNLTAVILLSDMENGFPVAFMEGSLCSNLRTASVGAVAAKYLARKNSEVIGFIGAGEQAKSHFLTMKNVFPNIKLCKVASRTTVSENNFIEQMKHFHSDVEFQSCESNFEKAVSGADIIVTAISAQRKLLQADWIKEGAFYCHVGGLEDDFNVPLKADKIVCDKWSSVKHRTQTISQMFQAGILTDNDIYADLHEIIIGSKKRRQNDAEFIYFNSVGMSFVDISLANWMYQKALSSGFGQTVELKKVSMFDFPSI